MATVLSVYANTGTQDTEVSSSGSEWTLVDTTNDRFIFSAGSTDVDDGNSSPSDTQLSSAGILLTGSEITIDRYFLDDNDAGTLKEIHNMGAGNYRYVLGFSFDGATASESVLEVWDSSTMDSIALTSLGAGTATSSWFRGITTTSASPGASWTGSRLAGSSDGNYLWLNDQNGALTGPDVLYCQLKIVVPSTQTDAGAETPIIAVKYATT
jgi:hypothetical protein